MTKQELLKQIDKQIDTLQATASKERSAGNTLRACFLEGKADGLGKLHPKIRDMTDE